MLSGLTFERHIPSSMALPCGLSGLFDWLAQPLAYSTYDKHAPKMCMKVRVCAALQEISIYQVYKLLVTSARYLILMCTAW